MWKFIKHLFKKLETIPYWPLVRLEIERESYTWKQELADKQAEQNARDEAYDIFEQWRQNPDAIFIPRPRQFTITIYPGQISRFANGGYEKYRGEKFAEYKKDYSDRINRLPPTIGRMTC